MFRVDAHRSMLFGFLERVGSWVGQKGVDPPRFAQSEQTKLGPAVLLFAVIGLSAGLYLALHPINIISHQLINQSILRQDYISNSSTMKPTSRKWAGVLLLLALVLQAVRGQVSFTVSSAHANPNTAGASHAPYTIVLNAITSSSTNFDISLAFSNAFSVASVTSCSLLVNGVVRVSAQCSAASNVITFTSLNIVSSVSSLTLAFTTSTAHYAGSFVTTLTYYQPGNTANTYSSNSALLTITNAPMVCTLTSISSTVGATTNYSLTYTPSVTIAAGSILQVQFPAWSAYTLTNFPSGTAASVCSSLCAIRNPNTGQGFFNQILTYSSLYSAASSSMGTVTMLSARNPASTRPISVTVNLLYYLSSTSKPSYMTCTPTFAPTVAGTFISVSFAPTSSTISGTSTISLFLSLANPVSSITFLSVAYAGDIRIGYSYVASNQQTTQATVPTDTANTLLIGNLTNSTSQVTSLFMASFTVTNAPYASLSNSVTFLSQNLVGGIYYPVDSRTLTLTSITSTLASATASATLSNSTIGATSTTLSLAFTTSNALISGSTIVATLPTEVSLSSSSTCTCSLSSTCSQLNSTAVQVRITAIAVSGGTNVPITVTGVNNPVTTTPTSSFSIRTYYINASTPVDTLTAGLTLTATATTLTAASVTPSSTTVAATTSYSFTLTTRNPLPATSHLILTFPTDFPTAASAALSTFTANDVTFSCSMTSIANMQFKITGCVPSSLAALSSIKITLTGITNPGSTKPTGSVQVETYYNNLLMEYIYSGMGVTMTTPASLSFASITPNDPTANARTSYLISLTFSRPHYSGDNLLLTLPASTTLNAGFTCTTTTPGLTLSCLQQTTSTLKITITGTPSSALTTTISPLTNNWYAGTNAFSLQLTTNDTANTFLTEQGTASATITPATLAASYIPTNTLILLSSSTLSIRFTTPFTVTASNPSLLEFTLSLPSDLTPTTNCTASLSGAVCSLSGQVYTVSNLVSFSTTLNLTFSATAAYFTTSAALISTLTYDSNLVAANNALTISPYCTVPCRACVISPSLCTSCLPSPYTSLNYLLTTNSSCLAACPAGYYLPSASTTCSQCDSSACLNCSGTATACTACSSPAFLSNRSCVLACPNTQYGDSSLCVPCVNQCLNCTNATYCLSCVPNYSLNSDKTCLAACPTGYLSLSSVCLICTTPCATCSGSLTFCSTCQTNYLLYNNTCVLACPLGKYKDGNGNCVFCISPCKYCSSALLCVNCVTNYFLYNSNTCVLTCPAGTYSVVTTCQACNATACQTCNNTANNCTSCPSTLYIYSHTCYSECPSPTYPYQDLCTTCVSPCATCLNGAFSCSTCEASYLLLSTSCVLACPSSGYTQISGSCVVCPTNCISCSSSATCSTCASSYYKHSGSCIASCPATSPIIVDQTCSSCATECATCQDSPSNCLTCTLYYFRFSYSCVETCPLLYFSNQLDYTCESGLSSKIAFFPVLISQLVLMALLLVIKLFTPHTSYPTALTAFSSWLLLAIWAYLLSLLFADFLEPGLNYPLPQALLFIAIFASLLLNFLHFRISWARLQEDDYARKWQDVNLNHSCMLGVRYLSLFTHHKFFRIIYSKIFHSLHFSLVVKRSASLFSSSTCFTLTALLTCELPVLVAAFYLAYNKLMKDQVFYSAVEALIVTVISLLVALIDIYKPEDYFEDTEFMETKRYLEKVNNDSINKLEDEYRIKDEGSSDGEKIMGMTGGKFVFSKQGGEVGSTGELLFEQNSAATDVHEAGKKASKLQVQDIEMQDNEEHNNQQSLNSARSRTARSSKSPRSPIFSRHHKTRSEAKINIFEPIQEEEAEYYEVLKYDEQDFKTAAQLEKEKLDGNASDEENVLEDERKEEYGLATEVQEAIDDNVSLMEYREQKEEWNKIIDHRRELAQQIFNTVDTKQLYRIDEPIYEDEEELRYNSPLRQKVYNRRPERLKKLQEAREMFERELREARLGSKKGMKMKEEDQLQEYEPLRRRRRGRKPRKGNKQLQEIYLQRLAEKVPDPKRKTMYASSKSFKYEF